MGGEPPDRGTDQSQAPPASGPRRGLPRLLHKIGAGCRSVWQKVVGQDRRSWVMAILLLLLLAAAGMGIGLGVWGWRAEDQARAVIQRAADERDQARKTEKEAKDQRDQAEEARQSVAKERDEALAAQKAAQHSEQATKTVLEFFQDKVLAAGRPRGWAGNPGKDVTLRQAVEAAESKVAEAFADRPLAEASIREILGATEVELGDPSPAIKQYERALALRRALLGPDNPDTVSCRNRLAVVYRLAGRTAEAGRLYEQDLYSSSHASTLAVRGAELLAKKNPTDAELKLRECLTIRQKIQPEDWSTFDTKSMLGEALLDQKKFAEAEPLLLSGYAGLKQHEDKVPPQDRHRLTSALERLVHLYEAWGKQDKADQWRKEMKATKKN